MAAKNSEAWVTCALTDSQVPEALVLANALRRTLTTRSLAIIASPKISPHLRKLFHIVFDFVFILETDLNTAGLSEKMYAKMYVLLLGSFSKLVFLIPTMLPLRNCEDLFATKVGTGFTLLKSLDTSIFVVKPSTDAFSKVMDYFGSCVGRELPMESILNGWLINQNAVLTNIDEKYNRNLGVFVGIEKEMCIVNLSGCDLSPQTNDDYIPLLTKTVLNYRKKIFDESVHPILSESLLTIAKSISAPKGYSQEPIAIIGMSCRFPGSSNLDEFWNLLITGEDATGNPPPFRWRRDQTSRNRPDCRVTNAGFLPTPVDQFDAKFFGISPKEMLFIDPQQRLVLEVLWESLEDAGVDPTKLRGSNSGVFVGSWTNDYTTILEHGGNSDFYRQYMGNSIGAAAARISFLLGITGPSIATESGCSSAMVGVHLACKSLQNGETNLALACGVNLLLHPFDKDEMPMMLAPDGKCKTFDEKADGFSRAEGCGVLILKRMSDAVRDGDNIWALIRGTGMAQEGLSRSMGTPTVHCEAMAMKMALEEADVDPAQVFYVETHGTGTAVGDPLEVKAIAEAYNSPHRNEPLLIGSVKTNVGHTESCSGITGIIKGVLAMHHGVVPPHRNLDKLNPAIDLEAVPAKIPMQPVEWPRIGGNRRLCGVSSFGITGTDAHAVLEEAPESIEDLSLNLNMKERETQILKISAKAEEALTILLDKFQTTLKTGGKYSLADFCHTANVGRANFNFRAAFTAKSREEMAQNIEKFQASSTAQDVNDEVSGGKICFLFTGQGSQYPGMGKVLYETSPIFRLHFDSCVNLLAEKYGLNNLKSVLFAENTKEGINNISRTIYSQTSIFCVEYALLKLWESWGINPDYVLGHSLGEFCAAVAAGILSVEDAIKLVAERSRLIDNLPGGKMLVIKASHKIVLEGITQFAGGDISKRLDIAAINTHEQTVVAGDSNIVLQFKNYCEQEKKLKTILLEATHAFHSSGMDPMLEEYGKISASVTAKNSISFYISGMRGDLIKPEEINAAYWVEHTREKVNFLAASQKAIELGCEIFIEVGPQPVLSAMMMMNNDNSQVFCTPSLKRNENEWTTLFNSLSKLWAVKGLNVNWEGIDEYLNRKKVRNLPGYPLLGKKCWPDMMAVTGVTLHPLLGSCMPNASSTKIFQSGLSPKALEYVKDHCIGSNIIFPGAGFLEMCLAAGQAAVYGCVDSFSMPNRPIKIENLRIEAPLRLDEESTCQLQAVVHFNSTGEDWNDLDVKIYRKIQSMGDEGLENSLKWLQHAHATFSPVARCPVEFDQEKLSSFLSLPSNNDIISATYEKLNAAGLKFGPIFRSLEKVWKKGKELLAKVNLPPADIGGAAQYIIHPVVADAMIQAIMIGRHLEENKMKLSVPIKIGEFIWLSPIVSTSTYIYIPNNDASALLVDVTGKILAFMSKVELIETTVKAVESVLEQQSTALPDLWEEVWRQSIGPSEKRIVLLPNDYFYNPEQIKIWREQAETPSPKIAQLFHSLDEFIYVNVLRCIHDLGWELNVGDCFNLDDLIKRFGINLEFIKFFDYLLTILEARGVLRRIKNREWTTLSRIPTRNEVETQLASFDDLATNFKPTSLLANIGKNLSDIFRGSVSALSVLFPDEKMGYPSVAVFYEDYGAEFNVLTMIEEASIMRVQQFQKVGGIIRIIEIGAGTGLFSRQVVKVLELEGIRYEYTYTDISAAFFPAAEKHFDNISAGKMIFKKLNIEEDPLSQGFVPEYYDYAIASDVIHATRDIRESLRNVNLLLRPNGHFDILEQTKINTVITYTFGLMEGFWRFEDTDLRPTHCTISKGSWREACESTGFGVTEMISTFWNYHSFIYVQKQRTVTNATKLSQVWIIFHSENCSFVDELILKFKSTGRDVIIVKSGVNYEELEKDKSYTLRVNMKEDFERLFKSVKGNLEGILFGWALDPFKQNQNELILPFMYIAQTVVSLNQKSLPRIITLTNGAVSLGDIEMSPYTSTLWGFTKSLRNEHIDLHCRCIDISCETSNERKVEETFSEIWNNDKETQVVLFEDERYIARFQPHKPNMSLDLGLPPATDRFQLILPSTKSIQDLKFGPLEHFEVGETQIEIQVKASALNFRDVFAVLKPSVEFKDYNAVGFDFAGIVSRIGSQVTLWKVGDSIFGVNVNGAALPSHVLLDEKDVIGVLPNMTLSEAATLPAVLTTSVNCLVDMAKLKKGETILIHSASGGVGLNAIELVKSIGANIIATAGSKRKQRYLRSLGIQHVFHSRNLDFAQKILDLTGGRGVDVVLNSLTSEGFKEATLSVCAKGGRFVEMGKWGIWQPQEVKALRPDVEYFICDLASLPQPECRRYMGVLSELLEKDIIHPVPYVRFNGVNIREALVYLQKAKHIGKVVCVMPEFSLNAQGQLSSRTPMFNPNATYLITGGQGGIGFEVAKWMLKSGAKHIVLANRSLPGEERLKLIKEINVERKCNIVPMQLDVSQPEQCRKLVELINKGELGVPALRGVMHAAGAINDGLIENQDWSKLEYIFNTKVYGTLNLHEATLDCALENFVVFSSLASLFGSPGQSNYAAGNSFQDVFIQYRHSIGLPGTSVNWGQWGEVGIATEVDLPGMKPLSTFQGLNALEYVLKTHRLQTCAMNMESFVVFSKLYPQIATYLDERFWKSLQSGSGGRMTIKSDEFWQQYDDANGSLEGKTELVKRQLRWILRNILKLDDNDKLNDEGNFQEMGVDSLMFVEIKNALQALLGGRVTVNANALKDCNNINLLTTQIISLIDGKEEVKEVELGKEEMIELLREDCQLPEEISAVGKKAAPPIGQVKTVLVTGCTGALGPYIIRELSNLPQISTIYCLTRRKGKISGEERLFRILTERNIDSSVQTDKLKIVEGDIAMAQLGFSPETWKQMVSEVEAVFHCAVFADHLQRYGKPIKKAGNDVRSVNIEGTKNVLEFASKGESAKHVYYASSLVAVATLDEDGDLYEGWPNIGDFDGVTNLAYPISKFVGDCLMKEATLNRNIPCKSFRFPLIVGDSTSGRMVIDSNHLMLRYMFILKAGKMPNVPIPMNCIPVDICAKVSIQLFFHEGPNSCQVYNISHPSPDVDQEFQQLALKWGYNVEFVELSEFSQVLKNGDKEEVTAFSMFNEFHDDDRITQLFSTPAIRSWIEGGEGFWVSKNVAQVLPRFRQDLEKSMDCVERDLMHAKEMGWFKKFGLE